MQLASVAHPGHEHHGLGKAGTHRPLRLFIAFKEVGNPFSVADSITYQAEGTLEAVEWIGLTLNVNSRSKATTHQALVFHGHEMLKAALGCPLLPEIEAAIRNGATGEWQIEDTDVALERKSWETGGYSLTLYLR